MEFRNILFRHQHRMPVFTKIKIKKNSITGMKEATSVTSNVLERKKPLQGPVLVEKLATLKQDAATSPESALSPDKQQSSLIADEKQEALNIEITTRSRDKLEPAEKPKPKES